MVLVLSTIPLLRGEEEVEKKTAGHGFRFPKVALASARTVPYKKSDFSIWLPWRLSHLKT